MKKAMLILFKKKLLGEVA